MAIQMNAVQLGASVSLAFTTVLDQVRFGLVEEDEEVQEATDRTYWESRGSKATVAMADELLEVVQRLNAGLQFKYNKFYIGLATDGQPNNFVIFRPQKNAIRIEPRLRKSDEIDELLETAGLDVMDYDKRWARYKIRLAKGDVAKHADVLRRLLETSYREFGGGDA